jgi:kynurenine formamidase
MSEIELKEFAYPLCVIDKSEAAKKDPDYAITVDDVLEWEKVNGIIPEGAFVAFRTDWAKIHPDSLDNKDADGNAHYPGWDLETIKWLVEKRNIGSIGHETSDTDPAVRVAAGNNFAGEAYILQQDKIQMELLCNLDQLPPTGAVIFCVFPKLKGGTGYPTRAFAIAPLD